MQSLSTGFHFNDIEFLFSDTSALNCKTAITHTDQTNAILMGTCEWKWKDTQKDSENDEDTM